MFFECSSLKELDLNSFNTDKVTDMSYIFEGCASLEELNIQNFSTKKVTNISNMFNGTSDELKEKIKVLYENIREEAFV